MASTSFAINYPTRSTDTETPTKSILIYWVGYELPVIHSNMLSCVVQSIRIFF